MNIFLSVGAAYDNEQRTFVTAFESFLVENGCRKLTVDDRRSDQPIFAARELMEQADAIIVLAFTRFVVRDAIEKPGSSDERAFGNRRYPTIWNQLEAAMGFGLKLPLLVILEEGLYEEAMLKDRFEYRTISTKLNPDLFSSETFKAKFKHWMEKVTQSHNRTRENVAELTVGQLLFCLKPGQLWKVGSSLFALMASVAAAAFWIGKTLS